LSVNIAGDALFITEPFATASGTHCGLVASVYVVSSAAAGINVAIVDEIVGV
jgi:hypothetical protein